MQLDIDSPLLSVTAHRGLDLTCQAHGPLSSPDLIPSPSGIRYVVDAGRSKQKLLEGDGSLARYDVSVDICTAQAPATDTLPLGESNSS